MTTDLSRVAAAVSAAGHFVGVDFDEDEIVRRLDAEDGDVDELAAFSAGARAIGLRVIPWRGPVHDIVDGRAGACVVISDKDGGVVVVEAVKHRTTVVIRGVASVVDADGLAALAGAVDVEGASVVAAAPMASVAHHASPWQRTFALARLEQKDIAVVVAYAVAIGLVSLVTPLAVQALVSSLALGTVVQPVIVLSVVVVVALLVAGLLRTLQLYVTEMVQRRLFARLVADLAWRLPRLVPQAGRDDSKFVNRFFDVVTLQKSAASLMLDGLGLALEIGVGLALLVLYSDVLLAFAVLLCFALVVVFAMGRGAVKTSIDESYRKHDVAAWFEELALHPTVWRGRSARGLAVARGEALAHGYLGARAAHFRVLLRQATGLYVIQALSAAALLGVGGALVLDGQLTLGQLVAAELVVFGLLAGLAKLPKQLETAYDLLAAIDKIGALVDLDVDNDVGADVGARALGFAVDGAVVGGISFIPFSVKSGEHVALFGPSGCGKSTLIDALVGARDVDAGRVSVDGDDVRNLSSESLCDRVGLARDVEIFAGTLAENLRAGRRALRPRDLVEVLRVVELDGPLLSRPEGLGLSLQHTRSGLSRSEEQRLMIARALLGAPGLVIVDGGFDDVDADAARRIIGRVRRHLKDTTLVVATSRPEIAAALTRSVTLKEPA